MKNRDTECFQVEQHIFIFFIQGSKDLQDTTHTPALTISYTGHDTMWPRSCLRTRSSGHAVNHAQCINSATPCDCAGNAWVRL
jgi:hypothetical protein